MTARESKQLKQLEVDALALRNLANAMLKRVRAAYETLPAKRRTKKKSQDERVADLTARILAGKLKH